MKGYKKKRGKISTASSDVNDSSTLFPPDVCCYNRQEIKVSQTREDVRNLISSPRTGVLKLLLKLQKQPARNNSDSQIKSFFISQIPEQQCRHFRAINRN